MSLFLDIKNPEGAGDKFRHLALGQPAADGLVVGVEEEGGEQDAAYEGDDGHGPDVGHGAGDVGEAVEKGQGTGT